MKLILNPDIVLHINLHHIIKSPYGVFVWHRDNTPDRYMDGKKKHWFIRVRLMGKDIASYLFLRFFIRNAHYYSSRLSLWWIYDRHDDATRRRIIKRLRSRPVGWLRIYYLNT